LKQEVKTLQEKVRNVSSPNEIVELREQIKNVEERIAKLSEIKQVSPIQRNALQKQVEELDKKAGEIAGLAGATVLPKDQQQKLDQQVQDLSKQVASLSSQNQIPQLQQQIKKLDTQISSLSKSKQLPQDQTSQLQSQIQELSKQVASLSKQDQVPLLREEIKQMQAQVDLFAKGGNAALQPIIIQQGGSPAQVALPSPTDLPKKELNPRYAPIVVFSGAGSAPALGVGYDKNIVKLKDDPFSKLQRTEPGVVATYIADRAHTIAQGKILTAVLETAIDTQVPGSVRAIVSRDVYAEAGNDVLIPRGSRLFGAYSSEITRGQGRVQIGWRRLIRPDGVDLAISFIAADQFGRSGIYGDVDNKYDVVIANSLLTSLLTIGGVAAAQALIGDSATTTTTNPTQGSVTTTGNATNQALYDVSKTIMGTANQIIGNSLNANPVIRVPQGTRIAVIVNSDIVIPSMRR
jgi:type IV secretory pathway VirB10-like protein